ncbi:hypothetical protein GGX14DRAFT_394339 [Mycena pura]|uniref:Uncharacterized protein n=1 Tax=Mycena pura TaxID=153505 RepID=A0AAD6YDJ1_9AGAR|nr:hypothetical protein GGX14DRAFT_394339 [Mycena pura]
MYTSFTRRGEVNLPEVRWSIANGMADMTVPPHQHLDKQRWRKDGNLDRHIPHLYALRPAAPAVRHAVPPLRDAPAPAAAAARQAVCGLRLSVRITERHQAGAPGAEPARPVRSWTGDAGTWSTLEHAARRRRTTSPLRASPTAPPATAIRLCAAPSYGPSQNSPTTPAYGPPYALRITGWPTVPKRVVAVDHFGARQWVKQHGTSTDVAADVVAVDLALGAQRRWAYPGISAQAWADSSRSRQTPPAQSFQFLCRGLLWPAQTCRRHNAIWPEKPESEEKNVTTVTVQKIWTL